MKSYKFDSIVTRSEADALKDMIFKRARERAEALTNEVQSNYTSAVQNDIMDLARDAFVANKNPFSVKPESNLEQKPTESIITEPKNEEQTVGFKQRNSENVKQLIEYNNRSAYTDIVHKSTEDTMQDARIELERKQSFMGALEFLNSQATITLIQKRGKTFEATA